MKPEDTRLPNTVLAVPSVIKRRRRRRNPHNAYLYLPETQSGKETLNGIMLYICRCLKLLRSPPQR